MSNQVRIPVTVEEYLAFFLNGNKTEVKEWVVKNLLAGAKPDNLKYDVCMRTSKHPDYKTRVGKTVRHEIDSWLIHNRHKFAVPV